MSDLHTFLRRARGLSLVNRWNFHYRITNENVAEHSFYVAFYAMLIMDLEPQEIKDYDRMSVLQACLVHDLEEAVTGDCPFLVKRLVKKEWGDKVARAGYEQVIQSLPGDVYPAFKTRPYLKPNLQKYVKAADLLDVMAYCDHEARHGNRQYMDIQQEVRTLLIAMQIPGVNRILNNDDTSKIPNTNVPLPADMTHL